MNSVKSSFAANRFQKKKILPTAIIKIYSKENRSYALRVFVDELLSGRFSVLKVIKINNCKALQEVYWQVPATMSPPWWPLSETRRAIGFGCVGGGTHINIEIKKNTRGCCAISGNYAICNGPTATLEGSKNQECKTHRLAVGPETRRRRHFPLGNGVGTSGFPFKKFRPYTWHRKLFSFRIGGPNVALRMHSRRFPF